MTNNEMINRFKDMADLADASYAKLHCIYENETFFNKWGFADNITKGYDNNGQPTAYAMAIEARFCQDLMIDKPVINDKTFKVEYKPTKLDNNIKNFVFDNTISKKQEIFYTTNTLSHRTKNFVNRYELVHHIPNTLSGFSATIFRDLGEFNIAADTRKFENDFLYIIAFRGTESIRI